MSKGQAEVINDLMRKISGGIRVAMPASIESYDFKTQKADIKIDMQELYHNGTSLDYPVLSGVPVIFPRCGGASITMPIMRGDTCLVMFLDRDSTAWLLGGKNVKPKSMRSHHLSDAVAIMGLSPFTNKSPSKNNTDMLISFDGSEIVLKPKGNIDIFSAKEINVKTENVIINCKTALVKSEETALVECKSASIKAEENIAIECKTANIKATEILNAECKTLTAKVSESASIECKNADIKVTEIFNVECKTLIAKVNESASVECQNANIKASGTIDTETPNFTQKGNMKIDGMLEVTGTSLLTGKLTSQNGIENSGANLISNGKVLETHTHMYQDVSTVTAPEGPCVVVKVPTNSGQTQ
jgi:phage gp45-like